MVIGPNPNQILILAAVGDGEPHIAVPDEGSNIDVDVKSFADHIVGVRGVMKVGRKGKELDM